MTLPPDNTITVFRNLVRVSKTPREIAKDIFIIYTSEPLPILLWSEEFESKLIWGREKAFDEDQAIRNLTARAGLDIYMETTEVLRGTKLNIEITLIPNSNE